MPVEDDVGFARKVFALNEALTSARLPFAFGGAIALTFAVVEPRTTVDIDVNVFVSTDDVASVLAALPPEVECDDLLRELLRREGQARLRWGITPVDIFLATNAFHLEAARRSTRKPLGDVLIPVLSPGDLAVFKAFFARPKDFIDISNMVEARSFDVSDVRKTIASLLGPGAPELTQFDAAVTDGRDPDRHEPRNRFPRP